MVIENATIECSAHIVFTPKKDRSIRFCADYQKVKAASIRHSNALPHMNEYIDGFGEVTVFPALDANLRC